MKVLLHQAPAQSTVLCNDTEQLTKCDLQLCVEDNRSTMFCHIQEAEMQTYKMSKDQQVSKVASTRAWSRRQSLGFGPESESPFEGDTDSGRVLLFDCTLSLVLCPFGQCTVLAGFAPVTSRIFSQVFLKYTIIMSHDKS